MPLARWLVPLIAALVLMGQSLAGWAAAGSIGEATCCCPTPERCKCGDHGKPGPTPKLRRCTGVAKLVAPVPLVATSPASAPISSEARITPAPPLPAPAALCPGIAAPPDRPPI